MGMPYKNYEQERACQRRAYQKNKQYYKDKSRKRRKEICNFWHEYKKDLVCVRCGENPHPAAMHFHHRNPEEKVASVSTMIRAPVAHQKIIAEIAKCDPVCANCHAIIEYERDHASVVQ